MRSLLLSALSIAVVLIAGCAGIPNLFGGDVINVQTKLVENGVRDTIIVKSIQTIPSSPMLPDQQVVLSFIIENKDNLKNAFAYVDLFNAPTMKDPVTDRPCNLYTGSAINNLVTSDVGVCPAGEVCIIQGSVCPYGGSQTQCDSGGGFAGFCCKRSQDSRICIPDNCNVMNGCSILPGEEKPVTFIMKTPSENEIKGIKTDTKLNFKIVYQFNGSLNMIVPVVNTDEIIKRQRTGEQIDLAVTKSYGSGPVQIDAELQGSNYILSNTGGRVPNPTSVILFTIKDRGSGSILNSVINEGDLEITFPAEIFPPESMNSNNKFSCNSDGQLVHCVNRGTQGSGAVPLYLDESRSSLRFQLSMRDPLTEPFRSYQITATVKYSYELRNSVDVTINPFQNV